MHAGILMRGDVTGASSIKCNRLEDRAILWKAKHHCPASVGGFDVINKVFNNEMDNQSNH